MQLTLRYGVTAEDTRKPINNNVVKTSRVSLNRSPTRFSPPHIVKYCDAGPRHTQFTPPALAIRSQRIVWSRNFDISTTMGCKSSCSRRNLAVFSASSTSSHHRLSGGHLYGVGVHAARFDRPRSACTFFGKESHGNEGCQVYTRV